VKSINLKRLIRLFFLIRQLQEMIKAFESKWNARLSSLTTPVSNVNVDQLLPIFKDLTTTCQQFNQQSAQMQRQIGSVVSRVQDVQMKLSNGQTSTQSTVQDEH